MLSGLSMPLPNLGSLLTHWRINAERIWQWWLKILGSSRQNANIDLTVRFVTNKRIKICYSIQAQEVYLRTDKMTKIIEIYERFSALDPTPNRPPREKIYNNAFKSLVGVTLSAQTKDERTAEACRNLFARAETPEEILALDIDELKQLIRPAGMYNNKAKNLRLMSEQLLARHGGVVPNDREQLMQLAGVGRKSTDIMMRFVFNEPAIAVDTHVHRIANRLGIANTRAEHKTAEILERDTPDEYRWGAHEWLIDYGKHICKARRPLCDQCMFTDLCDYYKERHDENYEQSTSISTQRA